MDREIKIKALALLNEGKISLQVFQCLFINPVYFVYEDQRVKVGKLTQNGFLERSEDEIDLSREDYANLINVRNSGQERFQSFIIKDIVIPFF